MRRKNGGGGSLDIHLSDLAMAAEARAAHPWTMIRVHIVSDYPADPLTGWPAETTRVTIRLPDRFATYAAEAYRRIQALIEVGEYFEIPSARTRHPLSSRRT